MKKYQLIKTATAMAFVIVSIATATSAQAWGPERATFTMEDPADYPTFNSITNNPTIGDEREFVRIGEIDKDVSELGNSVEVVPGHQYLVYIYFHNNASSTYNYSQYNYSGIATNTHMSSNFTTFISPENSGKVSATITADNTNPKSVWDDVTMTTSSKKVRMRYVTGSATIFNDWATNNQPLSSEALFSEEGVMLGLTRFNGAIPGCEEYHGVVTYVLQAEELSGSVEKTASLDGEEYSDMLEADPGDEVHFKLTIKNTGDIALANTIIRDSLPEGLTLVPGSVQFWANSSTTKETLGDDLLTGGYNFGTFGTGNVFYLTYRAKVGEDFDCGSLVLTNTAELIYDSEVSTGDKDTSSATIVVQEDDCPAPAPCEINPSAPGCTPEDPDPEELPDKLPETGPVEIVMAVIVVLGICGGGFYLWRTRRTLKTVEGDVTKAPKEEKADEKASEKSEK